MDVQLKQQIESLQKQQEGLKNKVTEETRKASGYTESNKHGTMGSHTTVHAYAKRYEDSLSPPKNNSEVIMMERTLKTQFLFDVDKDLAPLNQALDALRNNKAEILAKQLELSKLSTLPL